MSVDLEGVPQLTRYSPGGGCACKLPQSMLDEVLTAVRGTGVTRGDPALLVGLDPADDAAVYAVDDHRAWVITCDFLTPLVDDAYDWGRIAAANALSDVYAMGGRPLLTLNLLGWPTELSAQMLGDVLRGGADAVLEAEALQVGGHSIVDPVPKYGLVVVGEADPQALIRKGGGRAGDSLVLTKPLGVGVVSTALKRGQAPSAMVDAAVESMTRLNADAAAVARVHGLSGGTDVTGYGLIGHLHEMALAAGVAARIDVGAVPWLAGTFDLLAAGCAPDGTVRTLTAALRRSWFHPGSLNRDQQLLLADAQTSGGLLLAVAPGLAAEVVSDLHTRGDGSAAVVGTLLEGQPGSVEIGP